MTDATSDIKAGEMCTGLVDPADPVWRRGIYPSFRAGVYGFHMRNTPKRYSRH